MHGLRYGLTVEVRPAGNPPGSESVVLLGGGYIWIKSRQPAVEDQGLTEEEQKALEEMDAAEQDMLPPHGLANADGAVAIKQ